MAGRTLLVMKGGHPWGFRIEGGAEVRQPIRINKVLGQGKAYSHGIEVGDVLSSINGENASDMTISRARHLIRTSDDTLVLEVIRPRSDKSHIPEIRISESEHPVNGSNRPWISSEVIRRSPRTPDNFPRAPEKAGNLNSFAAVDVGNGKSGISSHRRNIEPAPIKPRVYDTRQDPNRLADYDDESLWLEKEAVKQFRIGATDAGPMAPTNVNQFGTPVSLPLSPAGKFSVSEDQFGLVDLYITEDPYDLVPHQQGKVLYFEGDAEPAINQYNSGKRDIIRQSFCSQPFERNCSRKFEIPETGYDSVVSDSEPTVYADYEFLPSKPLYKENKVLSPESQKRNQVAKKERFIYPDSPIQRVTVLQELDEECLRRKLEMEKVIAEEKQRQFSKELTTNQQFATISINSSRLHSDNLSPMQRQAFLTNGFSNDEIAQALVRPVKRVCTKIRGKARALHTFQAQSNRELSFKRNDVVYILRQIDKNWYEGERHGIVGIFPVTYVEIITSLDEARATARLLEGTATAIYNFKAQTETELPLRKGDTVTLIRRVDDNWYEGRTGRRQGIFPVSYVETHREPDTPMVTPMSSLAPTPVPGTPTCLSPVGSVCSAGPEIPSAPMSPLDSEFYESDRDAESFGALQRRHPLRTIPPTSPTRSDREIVPVRVVTSPSPIGAPIRAITSPPPRDPSAGTVVPSVQSEPAVRSPVTAPVPIGSKVKGVVSSVYNTSSNGTVLSPVTNGTSTRKVISPPPSCTPVSTSTSQVSYDASDSRISTDGRKVPTTDVSPKMFTIPANQNPKKAPIDVFTSDKESNMPFNNGERHQQTKSSTAENSLTPMSPTNQRPPSGRPGSVAHKTTRQKSGTKQTSGETQNRKDGFSKSTSSKNPYVRYRAVYSYKPQNFDELELSCGDIIYVVEKCADGWCVGISDKTKQFGTFPGNFVCPI